MFTAPAPVSSIKNPFCAVQRRVHRYTFPLREVSALLTDGFGQWIDFQRDLGHPAQRRVCAWVNGEEKPRVAT
jgi:hypothetical protein